MLTIVAIICTLCTTTYAAELSNWSVGDFINANKAHLVPQIVGMSDMRSFVTREQFCELIVNTYEKATGKKLLENIENPFTDCENQAVMNAYAAGLISGKNETEFAPGEFVTREAMAKILHNVMIADNASVKFPIIDVAQINAYEDISDVSAWALPSMSTVISCSLIGGVDGKLLPKENVTCEQAIVAANRLYNFFVTDEEKEEVEQNFVITSNTEGALFTDSDISIWWNKVEGAVSYNVLVRDLQGELLLNESATDASYIISKSVLVTGEYNVSVQANFENGDTMFSVPLGFKYEEPKTEEVTFANSTVEAIFVEAEKYIGTPYRYGGTTPAGFDCSGYVQYVFKNNGIKLKRSSRDQYASNGEYVSKSQLVKGDLVFFGSNGRVNHVGIYAGDGMMIHSPSTGKTVTYTSIETDYYKSHYIGAKRIIK